MSHAYKQSTCIHGGIPMNGWTINDWTRAYRDGADPATLLQQLRATLDDADPAWISIVSEAVLANQLTDLAVRRSAVGDLAQLPLYGVPFAVKDNIDVAAMTTTAGCPTFAYLPKDNATVVQRLVDAGAIVIGKTNLDQFATGLVGTRSPYGTVPNTFNPAYVSGGSSSGSASVVARGLVPFALGTDTAGSGRVPAGLNNIVGLKPTVGALSATGLVPACRTLDCISVFATTVADAQTVFRQARGFDVNDAYSRPCAANRVAELPARPRFGVPANPEFYGDDQSAAAYAIALDRARSSGAECVPLDFSLFDQVAALLYDGPWVAERYAAIEAFAAEHAAEIHPVVRDIIFKAKSFSAADAFKAQYQLAKLKRKANQLLSTVDALLVPTMPTHYRTEQVLADPVRLNSHMGKYTNFVNLLDWCALALPAGFRSDGLPFGVTLIATAWSDDALARYGQQWQAMMRLPRGATGLPYGDGAAPAACQPEDQSEETVRLAVVGAHLTGMPLNRELTERNATFVESTRTAADYRLFALKNTTPPKPGLARATPGSGAAIEVELWDIPLRAFGAFVASIPAPLGIGTICLQDGRQVKGFICEAYALNDATDITQFGGWRAYCQAA
jgi:allophanate hydrolase